MHTIRRSNWTVWLLGLVLPLLLFGCRKEAGETSAPGYYAEEDYYYEGGGEYDYAEAEVAADYGPESGSYASRGRSKSASIISNRQDFDKREAPARDEPPAPPAPDPVPEPVDASVDVEVPEQPSPEPVQQAPSKRQVIYTASMQVSVFDLDHAIEVAEALPDRLGGWLQQRTDNLLILRVPAEKLDQAMAEIAELGVVDSRALQALDVTAQYTDLEARIRVLEQMQAQLQALLAQAKDVEQALEIRQALDAITMELELARGQMRELAKSIAFSTLILRLVERGPTVRVPTSNDPFTWVDELGVEITEYR